jgi:hypothetical protein
MARTWRPTTAGIINLVCGVFLLIGSVAIFSVWGTPTATSFAGYVMYSLGQSGTPDTSYVNTIIVVIALACMIPGIVSILGGIYSIKRQFWGMALAGSISSFIYLLLFGLPAIVFTGMSKREFSQ